MYMTPRVLKNIEKLGLDYLVAIGGDDTLSYAAHLDRQGVKVICVPKTMDNDVRNTEYCIGFSSAVNGAHERDFDRQRSTVGSCHERIGIFQRLRTRLPATPRSISPTSLPSRCCIPEFRSTATSLIELVLEDKAQQFQLLCVRVLLSEGAEWEGYQVQEYGQADAFGHRKKANIAEVLNGYIQARGEETIVSDLTYDLRSGAPDFVDRMVANTFGAHGHRYHHHPSGWQRCHDRH